MNEIIQCTRATWSAGIGDPTVLGWVTLAGYFMTAAFSLLAFQSAPLPPSSRRTPFRQFWILIAIVTVLLGANKQLDMQPLLTAAGRCSAQLSGWYGNRRSLQFGFILVVIAAALLASGFAAYYFRRIVRDCWLAILGTAFVIGFVVIRAASFHHMDEFINTRYFGLRMNGILELTGLLAISANALVLGVRWLRSEPLQVLEKRGELKPMDFS